MATPTEKKILSLRDEPKRIKDIRRDIADMGWIGQSDAALLVYLAYTSRVLPNPVSVITRGPSGCGKSTLLDIVAKLFPDDATIRMNEHSKASLFNSDEGDFEHKILLLGERFHAKDASTRDMSSIIRQLQSDHETARRKSAPNPDCPGDWIAKHQHLKGPIVVAQSTTDRSPFEEDLNRHIQIWLDASPETIRRVMREKAKQYSPPPGGREVDRASITERHHAFQDKLEVCEVEIPYAPLLAEKMPVTAPNDTRTYLQLLWVIETLAVLMQDERKRNAKGWVIANLDDYRVARSLLVKPMMAAFEKTKKSRDVLWEKLGPKKTARLTVPIAKDALKHGNETTTRTVLKALVQFGALRRLSMGKKTDPAEYEWIGEGEMSPLPSVEAVGKFLNS